MDCWDLVVLGAFAFDIKKSIWACKDLRWGGANVADTAEMKELVE